MTNAATGSPPVVRDAIPLIHACRIVGAARVVHGRGVRPERWLERVGLTPQILDKPEGYVPGHLAWRFIGDVAKAQGLGEFGLEIGQSTPWRQMGAWSRPLADAVTLLDALRTMIVTYPREVAMIAMGLEEAGKVAWLWRRRTADVRGWSGDEQAEQYMLAYMIRVVQLAAGDCWLPAEVRLESGSSGWGSRSESLGGVRFHYRQHCLAVAVPTSLLAVRIRRAPFSRSPDPEPPAREFVASLRQIVAPQIASGRPRLERVANQLGTSPRTLRRQLAQAGTSWRSLLEDLVMERALQLLADGRTRISDIADELGYSTPSHFGRAFQRRSGTTPSAYRAQHCAP